MVCPKGCGCLGQAVLDTILEHPDCLFYLPIGLTVANGNVVMDNAKPFAQPCKAACKLSAIVGPKCSMACPNGQPGHHIGTRPPSNYVMRAQRGFPPTLRMDPWQQGGNGFHLHLMEMVLPC